MGSKPQSGFKLHIFMLVALLAFGTTSYAADTQKTTDTNQDEQPLLIDQPAQPDLPDRFEKINRFFFSMNDYLDRLVLKPVATVYNKVMPKPLNQGIHNVFNNVSTVTTIAEDLLQLEFYQMASDAWRLAINTTIGIGGLFDVASRMNLPYYENDFGLTLAKWGWKNSTYIVLPFWGPNTLRDGIGLPVDYFAFSVYPYIHPKSYRYAIYGVSIIDIRAQHLKFQSVMEEASFDKYVFFRDAYLQHRNYQIEQNEHRSYSDQIQGNNKVNEVSLNYDNT